ncbi:hypothetical protein PHLGIDRAFT_123825 [Phlebiopsis gigantea 11061_1 CR5-6]|uniref:Uncharacterized protein n=1 Tax=Phlebiopsis gigantea (strain 11061_1 CR5-6) TaxID=745531 RepID=A0A0C3SFV4_PHLG1|nr:hypothetical protein PHLGIDRAFT_123825 [Phlebiopsis gigantea 11061_1 CR5-6]
MSLFLRTEKLTNVGAMVLDRLRRVGESVVAIASRATPSSSQISDDLESSPAPAVEPATPQPPADEALPQSSEEEELRRRHAAYMLSEHRIKVRDFAYESKLPPVPRSRPRPILLGYGGLGYGGRRPLRRAWEECFGQEEAHFGSSEDREPKRRKLQRMATEPIPSSQSQPPSQLPGFGDSEEVPFVLRDSDIEFSTPRLDGQTADDLPDVVLLDWSDTEAAEGWIDTPPISPGGSYVPLPHTAAVSRPASLMDVDAVGSPQGPGSLDPSNTQEVEHTHIVEPSPLPAHSITATSLLSSLTSLSSCSSSPPSTPRLSRAHSRPRRPSLRDISTHYNSRPPTPPPPVPTPRYLLRNRAPSRPGSPAPRAGSHRVSGARPSAASPSRPPRKTRSSAAKRATGSVKAAPPKPVRRSPRNQSGRASRR